MNLLSFKKKDIENLNDMHEVSSIRQRLEDKLSQESYLGDFVLGAIDGSVTTFAVVAGVAGSGLPKSVAIILGISNLIADGFSMAAGNYQKAQSDRELIAKARRMEEKHIDEVPEGEREEVRQIFAKKGFSGELLEEVVRVITEDRDRWVDVMITEELGLQLESANPFKAAFTTFVAFVVIGLIPLLPFLSGSPQPSSELFRWSCFATAAAFFGIGCIKGHLRHRNILLSGLETLLIGGAAAAMSYGVGLLLKSYALS